MNNHISYAALSDIGKVRQANEDNWAADAQLGLFIVADGLGGHAAGALASQIVVATLPGLVQQELENEAGEKTKPPHKAMAAAITRLSLQMRDQTASDPDLAGMGSTVVCALIRDRRLHLAHLGDSRAYLLRRNCLMGLSHDDSLVGLLQLRQQINAAEAADHPARHRLTQSVGMADKPKPHGRSMALQPGDRLLLCTDGLTGTLDDKEIEQTLLKPGSLASQCQRLIDQANAAGGQDNITVLLVNHPG